MIDIISLLASAPNNFVIRDALVRCAEVVDSHSNISCSISGGADSDMMLDMLLRCGAKGKTRFVFFNTGIEYRARLEHLKFLEEKYGIQIERVNALKAIPTCVREYGAPFVSKLASQYIYRLQKHNFQWEDEPYDVLVRRYPQCQTALKWWCNCRPEGSTTTQFIIGRNKLLKEFMVENSPAFKISDKCCEYAKKKTAAVYDKSHPFDLKCIGVRKSEGGVRAAVYKNCFSESQGGIDQFRPIFWLRDADKEEYCAHYGVTHSACYTEYGFRRTGCVGCPYDLNLWQDLDALERYEPALHKLATTVFRDSYEYTRAYQEYRAAHS